MVSLTCILKCHIISFKHTASAVLSADITFLLFLVHHLSHNRLAQDFSVCFCLTAPCGILWIHVKYQMLCVCAWLKCMCVGSVSAHKTPV